MAEDNSQVKSYILWYNSASHGAKSVPPQPFVTRYFVGVEKVPCEVHGYHEKPSWTYDKDGATILDGPAGPQAKIFAEMCGYKDLTLEPIDELPSKSTPVQEKVH